MGIPKFFRWLSERYPAISQLIADNRIPEFDCLYLDMNGIIHNCTHKDSDSPTFRMTEDKMFIAIFNYIEHLFSKIKPKKLFFMAVDGVAPRAKMNQQRARRFRTALDAERAREKAIKEGIEMPEEDPFDSNCITPGTEFMARLSNHLKYFINKKVSEDVDWQGVEVVLSGHEVPGEGEHKIMEYIRQAKAQKDYDPNMRHCLYGLDADLIMLGLLSHDPHFCLLREEVTFGRQAKTKSKELEHQNFYLLHLCLVREYLELEFQDLKQPGALSFEFNMEHIIDDFILMAFFVGNDFLPNLPHLHINEGALALMFAVYKAALPKAKGYINCDGVIDTERLALLLDELSHVEFRFFEAENSDANWLRNKSVAKEDVMDKLKRKGELTISSDQRELFKGVKKYVNSRETGRETPPYDLPSTLPARDRKFVENLADDLNLNWKTVEDDDGNRRMQLSFPPTPEPLNEDGEEESEQEDDIEAQMALIRVMKRYENAKVIDQSASDAQEAMEKKYQAKFQAWKNKHYVDKFGWGLDNEEELRKLTENYVQGLQWVLYYYYRGIASWPWFYRYHYAPMISDIKNGLNANVNFELGQPFKPFQQLMGVLPDRSKKIVPEAYHDLMTNPNSPIIDFYPREFELDMNGKKQDWEAVVKIPFIDEERLLAAMATREYLLTDDEKSRNGFGVSLKFAYDKDKSFVYQSSLPGYFPDIDNCHCVENIFELPTMEGLHFIVGLLPGVLLGKQALAGFPSLKMLDFNGQLGFHGVTVFQQDSRNETMVITLSETDERSKSSVAKIMLGKAVYVGYPFLQEAKVVKVSDELFSYTLAHPNSTEVVQTPHDSKGIQDFGRTADRIENNYSKKLGMIIGSVECLIHVQMLKGVIKTDDGAVVKDFGDIPGFETDYAAQTIVDDVYSKDPRFLEKDALPVEEEFPVDSRAFFLGDYAYGRPLQVIKHENGKMHVWVSVLKNREPEFGRHIALQAEKLTPYVPAFALARNLKLHPLALAKLTSSLTVQSGGLELNLGLNLKFQARKLKVLGYSRIGPSGWEYSPKAVDLIQQYMIRFPEFVAGIANKPKGDAYKDTDFYPEGQAKAKMKEIGQWLKSIESKSFEKVPLEAEQLDSNAVEAIQAAAEENLEASNPDYKLIKNIPRNALLNPIDADQRISGQRFSLGDRVVYVLNSGRVPIAQRGTVVGIERQSRQTWLDVAFDTTYMGGTTLGARCKPFSGSTVPSNSVLNLTDRQIIAMSAASSARKPIPVFKPLDQRTYGAPTGPQLKPASAPPPLTGSFRGAVAGQSPHRGRGRGAHFDVPTHISPRGTSSPRGRAGFANRATPSAQGNGNGGVNGMTRARGRGRGGSSAPNVQGYTVVDGTDPMEGVRQHHGFRPTRGYHNVAPPANLDAGTGRGGFRIRGGHGTPRWNGSPGQRGNGGGRGRGGRGRGAAVDTVSAQ